MAITVGNLFRNSSAVYEMKLLAGGNGLDNLVEWVHIIEDDDASEFLRGNEVVLTAGILNKSEDWLLEFIKKLNNVGISAFIINIGPYTKSIPQEVIDYCNIIKMPLYTIPWKTRMVDITRHICGRIIKSEEAEHSLSNIMKDIIFNVGDIETQILQMERYGYSRDSSFCFIIVEHKAKVESKFDLNMKKVKLHGEKIARSIKELFIDFPYKDSLVMLLVNYKKEDIRYFVEAFNNRWDSSSGEIYMGISDNCEGMQNQLINFKNGLSALKMAKRKGHYAIFYEDLDIYKVLMNIDNGILKDYYKNTVGKLDKYDSEENTNLSLFLHQYLKNNGSQSLVAEKQFIHRNTVNNQLKKIEKITGYNPLELEDKLKLYLAYYIKDIL